MKKYFIKCGKLFDGVEQVLLKNINILVEGNRIINLGKNITPSFDMTIIDLSDLTVTPGLIDAHVHFDFIGPEDFASYSYQQSDERKSMNILYNAKKALLGGFTTVRLMGQSINGFGSIDAKRAIESGEFIGSRLFVAPHTLSVCGGHGDHSNSFANSPTFAAAAETLNPAVGDGPDFFRNAVRREVKYGADFIKLMATGGFASPLGGPTDNQLDDEELRAVINTALQLNKEITAHAYGSESIQKMLKMGISGIEHASLIDEDTCDLFEETGAYLVCTFMPYEEIIHYDKEKLATKSKHFIEKLIHYKEQLRATRKLIVKKILEDKIRIGYGTDLVAVYNNFECWREFTAWRKSGIPALRTLKAACTVNASIVGHEEIGVLAPGKIADICAWSRDIENDFEAISACDFVMKDGVIYKNVGD